MTECYFCGEDKPHMLEEHRLVPGRLNGTYDGENTVIVCANHHRALERLYDNDFFRRLGDKIGADVEPYLENDDREIADLEVQSEPAVMNRPVAVFCDRLLEYDPGASVRRETVYKAFNQWLHELGDYDGQQWDFSDPSVLTTFGQRLNSFFSSEETGRTKVDGDSAWKNLRLRTSGVELYNRATAEKRAAEPIRSGD